MNVDRAASLNEAPTGPSAPVTPTTPMSSTNPTISGGTAQGCLGVAGQHRGQGGAVTERPSNAPGRELAQGYTPPPMTPDAVERLVDRLRTNIQRVYIGNRAAVDQVIACLLAKGHLLIEDVPGVGKTVLATALARIETKTFHLGECEVVLDELPFGQYMEIEGEPDEILKVEKMLGAEAFQTESRGYSRLTAKFGKEEDGVKTARFERAHTA